MDEEEWYKAAGEDDDDPAVEDGDVLHDGQVCQGEVGSIRGDASKVGQVVHLANMMTFAWWWASKNSCQCMEYLLAFKCYLFSDESTVYITVR